MPANLGGSVRGIYTDATGAVFDGSGYTVVDIDGAFDLSNPALTTSAGRSKIVNEACIGQPPGAVWPTLCATTNFVKRPLWGDPSAGYFFSSLPKSSVASDAPVNQCRQTESGGSELKYCHYYHGVATAGVIAGQPTVRRENDTTLTYTGVAPGANVIAIKVGGGRGADDADHGWPIDSVVDALNYVNNGLLGRTDLGPAIVAVNISAAGSTIAGDAVCGAGSDGARIDAIAAQLRAKGVAVVMSAGNDGAYGTGAWTCGDNVIVVGATGVVRPTEPTAYTNISRKTRHYVPVGTADLATRDVILAPYSSAGSFYVWGTSFASPQVAGAFAVLRQKFGKGPSVASLEALMLQSGKKLTGPRAQLAGPDASVLDLRAALNGRLP